MAQFHIWNMCRQNPSYSYQFFDDNDISKFIKEEFGDDILKQYTKLAIGAAKADFFRYAILLKRGGIYLDIDSRSSGSFDTWILPNDKAIISQEANPKLYVQWALIYEKGHPFLQETMSRIMENIKNNRFPNNVHRMTGPTVYSEAINECMRIQTTSEYRIFGIDYKGKLKFKYWLSGFSFRKKEHWRKTQVIKGVLK